MSCTSSPREAKSVATRMRTRPAKHASCELRPSRGPNGPFPQGSGSLSGTHTVLEVLEGFFTVALLVASVQTLHSHPLQTHVARQVVSAAVSTGEETQRTAKKVRQSHVLRQ